MRLDYGSDGLEVDLPQGPVTVIEPVFRQADPDAHAALLAAMRAPIDSPPLRSLVKPGQKVAISVCDITRAQPRLEMLQAIFEEMPGIPDRDVTILIATGTHRTNTDAELERMLGREHPRSLPRGEPRQPRRHGARTHRHTRPPASTCASTASG